MVKDSIPRVVKHILFSILVCDGKKNNRLHSYKNHTTDLDQYGFMFYLSIFGSLVARGCSQIMSRGKFWEMGGPYYVSQNLPKYVYLENEEE